ncbi:hypothetical protein MJH12_17265, partial [bacterium]|nr:hypothetical protein [bacterium]
FLVFVSWDYAHLENQSITGVYPAKSMVQKVNKIETAEIDHQEDIIKTSKNEDQQRTITSTGVGATLYLAKQAAIRNCLQSRIESKSKTRNKALLYSYSNRVARGVVSNIFVVQDYQRKDGLYFVEIQATIGSNQHSKKDDQYFSQIRMKHPSIYLDTDSMHFYGDHYNKRMMKTRIVFQLEKALQDSYFELKTSPDSDYTLKFEGEFNAYLKECPDDVDELECMSVSMNLYPTMLQKQTNQLLLKSEISLENSRMSKELFENKSTQLFVKFVQEKTQSFVQDFVDQQIFRIDNPSKIEIKSSIKDFTFANKLHKILKGFYGVEEALIKMNPNVEIELTTLVDASFLAQSLHQEFKEMNVKITSVTRNKIFIERIQ